MLEVYGERHHRFLVRRGPSVRRKVQVPVIFLRVAIVSNLFNHARIYLLKELPGTYFQHAGDTFPYAGEDFANVAAHCCRRRDCILGPPRFH